MANVIFSQRYWAPGDVDQPKPIEAQENIYSRNQWQVPSVKKYVTHTGGKCKTTEKRGKLKPVVSTKRGFIFLRHRPWRVTEQGPYR